MARTGRDVSWFVALDGARCNQAVVFEPQNTGALCPVCSTRRCRGARDGRKFTKNDQTESSSSVRFTVRQSVPTLMVNLVS